MSSLKVPFIFKRWEMGLLPSCYFIFNSIVVKELGLILLNLLGFAFCMT